MRVAVLADIHGNLPALEAVLRDVEAAGVDAIVLGGDLADGPMPAQTLDRLEELGERALWVRGNTDRAWPQRSTARSRHRACRRIRPPAGSPGVLPRDDNEFILVDSPVGHYQAAFAGVAEQTIVIGHTHMPFDRLADERRFVNPGSVGLPYGHAGAGWAVLGPEVVLRRTQYDARAAVATLLDNASDLPGIEFVTGNIAAAASDAEALAAFTETIRQQAGSHD
jgi:putative phosphoesterase